VKREERQDIARGKERLDILEKRGVSMFTTEVHEHVEVVEREGEMALQEPKSRQSVVQKYECLVKMEAGERSIINFITII